ncbi:Hypothetical protein HDN1F_23440 [gamma proteobacterium HdN1]|nr:Hypothetical protein HDN1F_23440 [gamma proteobacterium HdN1]
MNRMRYAFLLLGTVFFSTSSVSASAWTVLKDFNSGSNGSIAQGNSDAFSAGAMASVYSKERTFEGGQSAELNITQGSKGEGSWGGIIKFPQRLVKNDSLWVRLRVMMPRDFDFNAYGEGNRLKFLRIPTFEGSSNVDGLFLNWYLLKDGSAAPYGFIYGAEGVWSLFGSALSVPIRESWDTYEWNITWSDIPAKNGGSARIRAWKNGKRIADISDMKTLATARTTADSLYLFSYWNGGSPKTQKLWVDEITLTTDKPSTKDDAGYPFLGVGEQGSLKPAPSPPSMFMKAE